MKKLEWKFIDKTHWGRGPWQREPDKMQFTDSTTGLPCLLVRGPVGAWCGYVGVMPGHPLHGKDYSECALPTAKPRGIKPGDGEPLKLGGKTIRQPASWTKRNQERLVCGEETWCNHRPEHFLNVHGGITFSGACTKNNKEHGICHTPEVGEPDNVWWFGFDCAHSGDKMPAYADTYKELGRPVPSVLTHGTYRDKAYVMRQCRTLAAQLEAIHAIA